MLLWHDAVPVASLALPAGVLFHSVKQPIASLCITCLTCGIQVCISAAAAPYAYVAYHACPPVSESNTALCMRTPLACTPACVSSYLCFPPLRQYKGPVCALVTGQPPLHYYRSFSRHFGRHTCVIWPLVWALPCCTLLQGACRLSC
jgi:hypothetical protein